MQKSMSDIGRRSVAEGLRPQEERLEVSPTKRQLTIGVPKEIIHEERRLAIIPDGVNLLTRQGHRVLVESGAGEAAHYSDHAFNEAGAEIVYSTEEVFQSAIMLKVAPLTEPEMALMHPRQTLISAVQTATLSESYFRALMSKKITALGFEMIRDKTRSFPVVRAMSEIAGCSSIMIAAEYLASSDHGRGKMFGGITGIGSSEVVIIGAGTVGEYAVRSALGLGALVKVFDNSVYRLRRLQNHLGARVYSSALNLKLLRQSMVTADVVIGAVHSSTGKSPCLISAEMIRQMKEGSVIIDVSIDQGGCFESSRPTTHSNPVYKEYGVTHYCVPNIASRVPHTASQVLNNIMVPIILEICAEGGVEPLIKNNYGVRQGVYLFNGTITNLAISKLFNLPFQDIDLLMAAFQ